MRATGTLRRPWILGTALLALASLSSAWADGVRPWHEKVHPLVLERGETGPVEFLAVLDEQADLSGAAGLATKQEKGEWVVSRLRAVAERTQAPLLERLAADGVEHRAFWITNMIWVRGALESVEKIALRPEVRRIDANPRIAVSLPTLQNAAGTESTSSVEWGIQKVKADQLWAMGYRGQGVVVGGQDTGYQWTHAAIRDHYRGWNGTTADHDYNWHDAIHSGGGSCGANSPFPCDDHYHGTHTMGTMVGDDGGSNQVGMAPEAKWIGCRNMNVGNGTPASYSECFEWFVAPTDVAGENPDPSKSPHVINNSWLCPEEEGCEFDTLQTVVENTRAAGILVVASAGNEGSACSTVANPPAIYEAAFSVGATDSIDNIASFSSRGPVTVDGSDRPKPDVSAPGVSVRSCVPGGGYNYLNGTSMAGPHVAGLAALVMSARPDLIGNVDALEALLEQSAFPLTSSQTCGGIPGGSIPNPIFGHGRIDGLETLLGDVDADGSSNLDDCSPLDGALWGPPGAVSDLRADHSDVTEFSWSAPLAQGASVLKYDLVRSELADDFTAATCVSTKGIETSSADSDVPGSTFFYLVRARNGCGSTVANDSSGTARSVRGCISVGD
jgi:serine protease AprX